MYSLGDFVSMSGVVVVDDSDWISEDESLFKNDHDCRLDVRGLSEHGFNGLIRLIPPVAICNRNGKHFICQIYWGSDRKFSCARLEGTPAIRLDNYAIVDSFIYLEFTFVPREARPYRSVCEFITDDYKPIRIDVIGIGFDPRNPQPPLKLPISDGHHNILSKCNFECPYVTVSRMTILSNQESCFSAHYSFGPLPTRLSLWPCQGELAPYSSVEITVSWREDTSKCFGYLLIPCFVSFKSNSPGLEPEPRGSSESIQEEVFASHNDRLVMQSISRVICTKGTFYRQSVCEKSTRSRDAKLSLASRIKMFERTQDAPDSPPDHYLGLVVILGDRT